ncbi:MAG: hypothetical protein VB042_09910 [Victivallaceae bacterium]|nr:hypothetical protein [Victivallaceae bacterium]
MVLESQKSLASELAFVQSQSVVISDHFKIDELKKVAASAREMILPYMGIRRDIAFEEFLYRCAAADFFGWSVLGTASMETFVESNCLAPGKICLPRLNTIIDSTNIGPNCGPLVYVAPTSIYINFCSRFAMIRLWGCNQGIMFWNDPYYYEKDVECGASLYCRLAEKKRDFWRERSFKFFPDYIPPISNDTIIFREAMGEYHHFGKIEDFCGHHVFLHMEAAQCHGFVLPVIRRPRTPLWWHSENTNSQDVFLTDNIDWAVVTDKVSGANRDFSIYAFPDGDDEFEKVNIEQFRNRRLFWVLLPEYAVHGGAWLGVAKAVRAIDKFSRAGMQLSVIAAGSLEKWYDIPQSKFIALAAKHVAIPEQLKIERFGLVDCDATATKVGIIKDFVDGGDVTVVEEFSGVKRGGFCRLFATDRNAGHELFERYSGWDNLNLLICASEGRTKNYPKFPSGNIADDRFMQTQGEPAMKIWRGLLDQTVPKVVVFDSNNFFDGAAAQTNFKMAIAECRAREIGIVVIFNRDLAGTPLPAWLRSDCEYQFALMPHPDFPNSYIWEKLPVQFKERFTIESTPNGLNIAEVPDQVLCRIPDRETQVE